MRGFVLGKAAVLLVATASAVVPAGCAKEPDPRGGTTSLTVDIVGVPVSGIERFYLNLKRIEVQRADPEDDVVTALDVQPTQAVDLLGLKRGGSFRVAGPQELDPGFYDAIVLHLADEDAAVIVREDGVEQAVPMAEPHEDFRLEGPFELKEGETTGLVVALHLASSLRQEPSADPESPRMSLTPLFSVINRAAASKIEGLVSDKAALLACAYPSGVTPDHEDVPCAAAAGVSTVVDGRYEMAHLPEGSYDVGVLASDGSFRFTGKGVEAVSGESRSLPPPVPRQARVEVSPAMVPPPP